MRAQQQQNASSSLDIVEPENRIIFTDSSGSKFLDISGNQDLSYSKDQSSLSFFIQGDKKSVLYQNHNENHVLTNQPAKRFRKQIFDKYKSQKQIQTIKTQNLNINTENENENDIMKAFDQIFNAQGTPKSLKNMQLSQEGNRESQVNRFNLQRQQQIRAPSFTKNNQVYKSPGNWQNGGDKFQRLNFSDLEYRLSVIQGGDQIDYSRDSSDIAQFLSAQIFQEKHESKTIQQASPISSNHNQIVQNKIKFATAKPITQKLTNQLVTPPQVIQPIQNKNINTINIEQNLQQSRFSDVYQRIDMTQSTVNASVFVKNPRIQIFNNNNSNFMGINESRMLSKSNSQGFLRQQSQTLINTLGSQRIIQEAAQDPTVPIFMRKAVKLNSVVPNFYNTALSQTNFEAQNEKLQQIVHNFADIVSQAQTFLQAIRTKQQQKKQILQLFANGINQQKFRNCGWQSCMQMQHLNRIKPRQNFIARPWSDMKVQRALENYKKITQSHRGIKINLKDQRGIKKYWDIRQKYNQIQKNLILIVEDMYTKILCLAFPQIFVKFKQILQEQQQFFSFKQIRKKQIDLEHFIRLRNCNEQLCSSEVGAVVISKLSNQIKFNSMKF